MAEDGTAVTADASSGTTEDPGSVLLSKGFLVLLAIAAIVGIFVSLGPARPIELPGVILAGLASIGSGFVVGPKRR